MEPQRQSRGTGPRSFSSPQLVTYPAKARCPTHFLIGGTPTGSMALMTKQKAVLQNSARPEGKSGKMGPVSRTKSGWNSSRRLYPGALISTMGTLSCVLLCELGEDPEIPRWRNETPPLGHGERHVECRRDGGNEPGNEAGARGCMNRPGADENRRGMLDETAGGMLDAA